jgi:EF hand
MIQVGTILSMLGHQLDDAMLKEIIDEVDADGSGELEFEEFVTLAARFMVEEDAEVCFVISTSFVRESSEKKKFSSLSRQCNKS